MTLAGFRPLTVDVSVVVPASCDSGPWTLPSWLIAVIVVVAVAISIIVVCVIDCKREHSYLRRLRGARGGDPQDAEARNGNSNGRDQMTTALAVVAPQQHVDAAPSPGGPQNREQDTGNNIDGGEGAGDRDADAAAVIEAVAQHHGPDHHNDNDTTSDHNGGLPRGAASGGTSPRGSTPAASRGGHSVPGSTDEQRGSTASRPTSHHSEHRDFHRDGTPLTTTTLVPATAAPTSPQGPTPTDTTGTHVASARVEQHTATTASHPSSQQAGQHGRHRDASPTSAASAVAAPHGPPATAAGTHPALASVGATRPTVATSGQATSATAAAHHSPTATAGPGHGGREGPLSQPPPGASPSHRPSPYSPSAVYGTQSVSPGRDEPRAAATSSHPTSRRRERRSGSREPSPVPSSALAAAGAALTAPQGPRVAPSSTHQAAAQAAATHRTAATGRSGWWSPWGSNKVSPAQASHADSGQGQTRRPGPADHLSIATTGLGHSGDERSPSRESPGASPGDAASTAEGTGVVHGANVRGHHTVQPHYELDAPCHTQPAVDKPPFLPAGRPQSPVYRPVTKLALLMGVAAMVGVVAACPAGQASGAGSAGCVVCGPGYYSAAGDTSCTACGPGTDEHMRPRFLCTCVAAVRGLCRREGRV